MYTQGSHALTPKTFVLPLQDKSSEIVYRYKTLSRSVRVLAKNSATITTSLNLNLELYFSQCHPHQIHSLEYTKKIILPAYLLYSLKDLELGLVPVEPYE